ncbi:hypothetical protein [Paraeggerthella sp. Marseille-Q4926]|uniref:hypothetical protein n=1 Tax=Paraeggerthella sp. Marseille-Q4926 TaxID=2866587 RepID=UPI001CE3F495|nr:hypothetical protein [Paraeggerthella sp. Marseille-Q4926]
MMQAWAADDSGAGQQENGLTDPAKTDIESKQEHEPDLSFDEKLSTLEESVTRHPLNREILYKILAHCTEERLLSDLERYVASCPEFRGATQNPHHMALTLKDAYGLELIERDQEGCEITPERKLGLNEDELDDLVDTQSFRSTEVGSRFVELHHPQARLIELLDLAPERASTYRELLEFILETPRSYPQIETLLQGKPVLEAFIDGERIVMQPSVFVDELERSGALVWDGTWNLTKEGTEFLRDLQEKQSV